MTARVRVLWRPDAVSPRMSTLLPEDDVDTRREVASDAGVWLRQWLPLEIQRTLVAECRALMDGPAGGYVPTVRGGGKMHVRMLCLGRHWNAQTYRYAATREDFDNAPVPPVPAAWVELAAGAAAAAGFTAYRADLCLINFYGDKGRMGLHQDKDESPESLDAGLPVVSVSLGDTASFLFGGPKRRDPAETILLESGDVFVFGGGARRCYHGVSRIFPGSSPPRLGLAGRFNLTFRKY